jgi:hypothetical protein
MREESPDQKVVDIESGRRCRARVILPRGSGTQANRSAACVEGE